MAARRGVADTGLVQTVARNPKVEAPSPGSGETAVRAVDRSLENGSATALLSVLSLDVAAEARRRLERVLDLRATAALGPGRRRAYEDAAGELRDWAVRLYLGGARREPRPVPTWRRPVNPYSEEGISIRRHLAQPRRVDGAGREKRNERSRR